MKFSVAQRLFYFIETYGIELGVEAFYADQGFCRTTLATQYPDAIVEDGSTTFYAVRSTPITAES